MADALVSSSLRIALRTLAQVLEQQIGLSAGAARELERIRSTFQYLKAYLRDAESKQVANESVRVWLSKLKGVAHDIEDVLDEWQISGLESDGCHDDDVDEDKVLTCFPSPCAFLNRSASRCKIARQIKEIRERLDQIAENQKFFNFTINSGEGMPVSSRPQTSSLFEESHIIGRDEDKETVISRMVSGSSSGDGDGQQVHVTAIVGIGGLGKTTLAQQIYNDGKVRDHFNKALYWVCVSEVFDVIRLTKAILQEVESSSTRTALNSLQKELLESLRGRRFLLVLDDVWNDDAEKWETLLLPLKSGAQGSRILVTTRSKRVADIMNAAYVHELQGLSEDLSWQLFSNRAFVGRTAEEHSELESIGREIVKKCKGIPLSIKVVGSAMNSKRTRADWQNVLDSKMWSLPQVSDKILPALMLSYYNLPPYLKQCFAYCSTYWKGTEMEKDELVKLWVAQGFIQPQGKREMEDIGEEYFNDLAACSMFQEVRETYQEKTTCKMHDLLHNLAEFIMKNESYIFTGEKSNQCSIDVRHVSLFLSQENPRIPMASIQAKQLRTLFVHGLYEIDTILDDLFGQARFLRVLVFRWCGIEMVPKTIGKLKHLRYLDLSWSKIVELPNAFEKLKHLRYLDLSQSKIVDLPESMCHLVNLHTLNLNFCRQLRKLLRGMGGMVSLRHLQIEGTKSLECLPKGLGRISCLQSLCKFIVGGEGGCRIDELQKLNCLQGSLEIRHLERVPSPEEAEKAELWNKSHLRKLDLRMSSGRDEEIEMSGRNDAEKEMVENGVLDCLQPHDNLEELDLDCNSSSKLKWPSWMEDPSFSKLTKLYIRGFSHCEQDLLGLGKLPALKYLKICEAGVRKMGNEFYYGMTSNDAVDKGRVAFPVLEKLILHGMRKLEEWGLTWKVDASMVMPSLHELVIFSCLELRVLPPHLTYAPLMELTIENCDRIKGVRCSSFPRLQMLTLVNSSEFFSNWLPDLPSLKVFTIDRLRNETLPNGGWEGLLALQELEIGNCNELKSLPDGLATVQSLEGLQINNCKKLASLPSSLGRLKKLRSFAIIGVEVLLPDWLGQLKSLEQLAIEDSQRLESLPHSLGQFKKLKSLAIIGAESLSCLPDSLGQLESLEQLTIDGSQKLVSLPHSLGQLKKLKSLAIIGAESLSCLPDSLGQLESLEQLTIDGSQKLVSLPYSLGQLKKLKSLAIISAESLSRLPDSLGQLESMEQLTIDGSQKLVSLPHSLGQLKALTYLNIKNCMALESLPHSLGQLRALTYLNIENCTALESLPHSLGQLKAFTYLNIENCTALESLPHGLQDLSLLQQLHI